MASIEDFKKDSDDSPNQNNDDNMSDDSSDDAPSTEDSAPAEATEESDSSDQGSEEEETSTPSMMEKVKATAEDSVYETDDAHIVPMLTRLEGTDTSWVGVAHPQGYFFAGLNVQGSQHARQIRNRVTEELTSVGVSVGPTGNLYVEVSGQKMEIGSLLNYDQNELDLNSENVGNLRLFETRDGKIQPTNGRFNKHGQRLVNQLTAAYVSEDDARIKAYLRFIDKVFGSAVEVDLENNDFTGIESEGLALENALAGEETIAEDEEEVEEDFLTA